MSQAIHVLYSLFPEGEYVGELDVPRTNSYSYNYKKKIIYNPWVFELNGDEAANLYTVKPNHRWSTGGGLDRG